MLPKKVMPFLWYFIKKQWIGFSIISITAMIWSINEMFFPYFLKIIVNTLQNSPKTEIFKVIISPLSKLFFIWLIMELSMRAQGITMVYMFPKFRAHIRTAIFNYVKHHSHQYFANHFGGSIAKKITDLPSSCQSVVEILLFNFVTVFISFAIAFTMMAKTSFIFAGMLLAWFSLHILLTFIFIRRNNSHWKAHSQSVSILNGKIIDILSNIFTVKLFARHKYESCYLNEYQTNEIKKSHHAVWSVEALKIFHGLSDLTYIFATISTLLYGWSHNFVSLGDFTLIGMLAFWMLGMIWYLSYQLPIFIREIAIIRNALTLITTNHEIIDKHPISLVVKKGEIKFNHISFSYPKSQALFYNLNLVIPAGQKVGIVGTSGSGKSTLINLLLRFYDLQNGQILIDNQDIKSVSQDSLREQIAVIPQEPSLFHRSLMENIRYGRLDARDEEVIHAAKLAHCHEFINLLPEGYATIVGDKGSKISGGQRQRIAIARAILKNAPILILDEATSALDSITEQYIQESLHHLMQYRTTIVIAHRLSTLSKMDRILVFNKGTLVEDDAPQILLEKKSKFAEIWKIQKNGFLREDNSNEKRIIGL